MTTKWSIGNLNKGKHLSLSHRDKISKTKKALYKSGQLNLPDNTGKTPWNQGKKWSEVIRRKISKARAGSTPWNVGVPQSTETKQKISASRKGKPAWNKDRTISNEHKKAISEAMKAKWQEKRSKQ